MAIDKDFASMDDLKKDMGTKGTKSKDTNPGNFAQDKKKAKDAGKKGGESTSTYTGL